MAINDAVSAYAAQTGAADQAYKDAWANTPTGGAGQFGGAGVFENASKGLSATAAQNPASTVLQTKPLNVTGNDAITGGAGLTAGNSVAAPGARSPLYGIATGLVGGFARAAKSATKNPSSGGKIDALPTTPTASASTDPIKAAIETTSNFSRENPYVADVTDAGDVGRQAERPDRLAIDDTMSADEQYRRAWQNESNGFYGNTPDVTEKPAPAAADPAAAEPESEGPDYRVNRFTMGDEIGGQTQIVDKATNKIIHTFGDDGSGAPAGLMEGLNDDGYSISARKLKELTGWEYDPNKWNPYTEQNVFRNYKPPVAATPSAAAPSGTNTGEFS